MSDLKIVSSDELSLVENNILSTQQLGFLLKKTPEKYIRTRPAKGGGVWEYVSGGYVRKCLNLMFGWDWSFEIIEEKIMYGEAIVKGKLTVRSNGKEIIKTQYGNKDIVFRKLQQGETERQPLSIGNDLKAAATDCLKKCAAELGIASDIYNKEEFTALNVVETKDLFDDLVELYDLKKESLSSENQINFERIINNKETKSYSKAINHLQKL